MLGEKIKKDKLNKYHALVSAACILVMYLAVLVVCQITPFGEKTFLMFDLKRQYVDYYAYLRTVYSGKNSVFYSFNAALGSGTLGFFAYYLTSPFLLILSLFNRSIMPLGITVVIGIKLMLAAVIMDLFLQRFIVDVTGVSPTATENATVYIGAVSWAFSGFLFAHSMNMMWMDVVMLLPLYIWSLDRLFRENKKLPFIVTLFLMLMLNYYITYQVILFTVFWTIADLIVRKDRHPFAQIAKAVFSALISVLLSAFVMVPTFLELMDSPKDVTLLGMKLTGNNLGLLDIFSKLPTFSYDYIEARFGYPQIFCGVLALFMILLFFFCKEISLRQKLGYLALFLVFGISFSRDIINLVWHAGMEPSGHPYRQAFMCVFLMIVCGCSALAKLDKELSVLKTVIAGAVILGFLILLRRGYYDHFSDITWYANLALIAVYMIILLGFAMLSKKQKKVSVLIIILIAVNMADLSANAAYTYYWQSMKCENAAEYKATISKTQEAVKSVKSSEDNTVLYRMENLNPRQQNDAFQYDYNGITQYSSAGLVYVRYFLQRLGLNDDGLYTHYGHDNTETLDSLLGIKYIMTDGTYQVHPGYELTFDGDEKVYKNPYALSAAVFTNGFNYSDICDIENNIPEASMEHVPQKDAFSLQEDIYGRLLGKEVSIFKPAEVEQSDMYMADDKPRYDYKVTAAMDGELYFYLDGLINAGESLSILIGDEFLTTYGNAACVKILNLGYHKAGDVISMTVQGEATDDNFGRAIFVTEDTGALEAAYNELSVRKCDVRVKSFWNEMNITVPEGADGIFLTVPYETAWKITVNGKKTEAIAVYDSFTYIPLNGITGECHIKMDYVSKGLFVGIILSVIGVLLFVYVVISEKKRAEL
ncbi:YfhO family protein [Butyrivibrio sp. XPD2006]|uniref:YfhO family protein n=1 Tax=Butyrivibrio sp. XPD2006 TaxID=1280668 RepID=UPI0003B4342B|nr:YfhO family protein [Butyrivibrio sp. XPD2006]